MKADTVAEVLFYHLTRRPLERALPEMLEKCLARGWKAVVRAGSPERAEALNARLWTFRDDSFLPHGTEADGSAEAQPVYLTAGAEVPNGAEVLFLVDGSEEPAPGMARFARVAVLFDGHDEAAVAAAREQWQAVTGEGLQAAYWAEDSDGRWVKRATSEG